ncbi:MAG: PAS domain-containing protein [Pirellulales bacterium]
MCGNGRYDGHLAYLGGRAPSILFAAIDASCIALPTAAVVWHLIIQPLWRARAEIEKLALVASHCQHGVVITDAASRIEWVNETFERLTGFGSHEVIGLKAGVFLHGPQTDLETRRVIREGIQSRKPVTVEIINYTKDGRAFWNSLTINPVYNEAGELIQFVGTQENITTRKCAEVELRRSETKYRTLYEKTNDAVMLVDANGCIVDCNAAALAMFGCTSRDEICSKHATDLSPLKQAKGDLSSDLVQQRNASALATGSECFEWVCKRADTGALFFVEINLSPVRLDEKPVLQAVIRDITVRRQQESLVIQAQQDAVRANRAKSEFLATMSHELRTPLNGILGMNELLLSTELSDRQRQYVAASSGSGTVLLQLINDILDLSKIEAGKLELDLSESDLEALTYDIVEIMSTSAQAKGLALQCRISPEANVVGLCDDNRLRQILVNLIGNAIKFTSSGSITVSLDRVAGRDGTARLRFVVSDTGMGIPLERLDRLFKPFSQVDGSTTRQFGGTGLGLSICKQLVELMGGKIGVESQVGVGTTFWFEIDMATSRRLNAEEYAQQLPVGTRILAIEGLDWEQRQLGDCLHSWNCPFVHVATVGEALAEVRNAIAADAPLQVLLADCRLVAGDEFGQLQELVAFSGLHVIGLGSPPDELSRAHLRQLGVRHVLGHPVRPSALFGALVSVMSETIGAASDTESCSRRLQQQEVTLSGHVLVAEDNRINQLYIGELLKHLGCTCDIVANGEEALYAVERQRYDLVLMDCRMPEMDGFAATREIRQREACGQLVSPIAIVALTANALKGDRERCLEAGMDDYLSKPIEAHILRTTLEKYVGRPSELLITSSGGT